jgi:hypothetical protein
VISSTRYWGDAYGQGLPVLAVSPRRARFWTLRAGTPGLSASLEDPSQAVLGYRMGGPLLVVWNSGTGGGGGEAFDLKDHVGATLATLAVDDVAKVWLGASSAASGVRSAWDVPASAWQWIVRVRPRPT